MQRSVSDLAKVPMQLSEPPWLNVLWDPRKKKIIRNFGQQYLEGILLYMVGQEPRRKNLDLLQQYRAYVGDDNATLPDPATETLL